MKMVGLDVVGVFVCQVLRLGLLNYVLLDALNKPNARISGGNGEEL